MALGAIVFIAMNFGIATYVVKRIDPRNQIRGESFFWRDEDVDPVKDTVAFGLNTRLDLHNMAIPDLQHHIMGDYDGIVDSSTQPAASKNTAACTSPEDSCMKYWLDKFKVEMGI